MVSRLVLNLRNLRANSDTTGPPPGTMSTGVGRWYKPEAAQKRSMFDTVVGALGDDSQTFSGTDTDYLGHEGTAPDAKMSPGIEEGIAMAGFRRSL
jgi:hypothetical protein